MPTALVTFPGSSYHLWSIAEVVQHTFLCAAEKITCKTESKQRNDEDDNGLVISSLSTLHVFKSY